MNTNSFHPLQSVPELLSPAGSYDALKSAVANGADAVYVGLKVNNARMGAENFDFDTLKNAVSYAHSYGVKVFLTLNTLLSSDQLDFAVENALRAAALGVDSLICQDMGLSTRLLSHRNAHPGDLPLEIHASTQMSIYNKSGLEFLKSLGFDRCITARELRLSELEEMCKANIMDIEFFCHGALCISVSGQCLLSAYLSGAIDGVPSNSTSASLGRSGNKGTCAGPCRLKYAFDPDSFSSKKSTYDYKLSPSDVATLGYLDDVIKTGVRSLKIEGRLKSPEYVAYVTRQYRNALDNYKEYGKCHLDEDRKTISLNNMQLLFGRDKFISGNHFNMMQQDSITLDYPGRKGLYIGTLSSIPVKLPRPANMPKNLTLYKITVKSSTCSLKSSDGITILKGSPIAGGSVNKVEKSGPNTYNITIAGSIEDGRFFTDKFINCPVFQTYSNDLYTDISNMTKLGYLRTKKQLSAEFTANIGKKPQLTYTFSDNSGKNVKVSVSGDIEAQKSYNSPVSKEDIRKELIKLGNTPYECIDVSIHISDNIFLPMSTIKALRRDAIAKLDSSINKSKTYNIPDFHVPSQWIETNIDLPSSSLYFYNSSDFMKMELGKLSKPVIIYLPMDSFSKESTALLYRQKMNKLPNGSLLIAYFPYINIGNNYTKIFDSISSTKDYVDGYMLANPGDYEILRQYMNTCKQHKKFVLTADNSFNVCNTDALNFYHKLGISSVTLSPEMSSDEIIKSVESLQATDKKRAEYISGGPITLMRMRYCLLSDGKCKQCKKMPSATLSRRLSDISAKTFTVKSLGNDCHNILLSAPLKRSKISHDKLITRYNI